MSTTLFLERADRAHRTRRPIWNQVVNASRRWTARTGVALVGIVLVVMIIGPLLSKSPRAFVAAPFESPSADLWLGADTLGRDVFARAVRGGYVLMVLALTAAVLNVILGAALGLLAGATRSRWGDVVMRISDVLLSFPRLVLILLVMAAIGRHVWAIPILIGLSWMPQVARVVRALTVAVMEQDYIKAAEGFGIRRFRLLTSEVLPNITGPLLVEFGIRFTWSIGVVGALSFLGFGASPGTPDWGLMINENRGGLVIQPWGVLAPVILIVFSSVGVNLITDGFARAGTQAGDDVRPAELEGGAA